MLEKLYWDETYSVGCNVLDEQHQKLINICNKLADNIERNDFEEFHIILHELAEYSRYHFTEEENILKKCGYSEFHEHINGHDYYREKMCDVLENSFVDVSKESKINLYHFISNWWKDHILIEDMLFKHVVMSEIRE